MIQECFEDLNDLIGNVLLSLLKRPEEPFTFAWININGSR